MKIDELRALLSKATPGPWTNLSMTGEPIESVWTDKEAIALWDVGKPSFTVYGEDARNDAALIAAMRNSYEALLDVAEAAKMYRHSPSRKASVELDAALAKLETP